MDQMTLNDAIKHLEDILQSDKKWNCEECRNEHIQLKDWLKELKGYKDLDEQGKLPKMPCAVGDTVYEVQEWRERIQPYIIIAVHISDCGNSYKWQLKDGKGFFSNVKGFSEYALGKTVFFTKKEAEDALKELERSKDK